MPIFGQFLFFLFDFSQVRKIKKQDFLRFPCSSKKQKARNLPWRENLCFLALVLDKKTKILFLDFYAGEKAEIKRETLFFDFSPAQKNKNQDNLLFFDFYARGKIKNQAS